MIEEEGIKAICDMLVYTKSIQELRLENNFLHVVGTKNLVEALI